MEILLLIFEATIDAAFNAFIDNWLPVAQTLASCTIAASAVFGSITAWRGLRQWKSEFKSKRKYDLARSLLRELLRYEKSLNEIREPWWLAAIGRPNTGERKESWKKVQVARELFAGEAALKGSREEYNKLVKYLQSVEAEIEALIEETNIELDSSIDTTFKTLKKLTLEARRYLTQASFIFEKNLPEPVEKDFRIFFMENRTAFAIDKDASSEYQNDWNDNFSTAKDMLIQHMKL